MTHYEELQKEYELGKPVVIPCKGKTKMIGTIYERKFIKVVRKSKHFLHSPPAIAIDADAFTNQIMPQCENIFVLDIEGKEIYSTSVETFLKKKFAVNRKFEPQVALPMKYWGIGAVIKQTKLF